MKARIEDLKSTLSQPWLLALLMVAVIPLFPEYIAPLLAIGAVIAANADAKRRGRVLSVGPIGKLLLLFMLYTAFGVLYSKHPFNSFATFLMWLVMFLVYLAMTTVMTNRHRFDTALFCISVIAGIVGLVGLTQYVLNCVFGIHVSNQFWSWIDNIVLEWIPMDINITIREMRFSSTFTNPNIVGEYLVMVIPFVLRFRRTADGGTPSVPVLPDICRMRPCFLLFTGELPRPFGYSSDPLHHQCETDCAVPSLLYFHAVVGSPVGHIPFSIDRRRGFQYCGTLFHLGGCA